MKSSTRAAEQLKGDEVKGGRSGAAIWQLRSLLKRLGGPKAPGHMALGRTRPLSRAEMAFSVRFWGEILAVARLMDELTSPDSRGDAGFLLAGVSSVYIVRGHLKGEEKKNERTGGADEVFFRLGLEWIKYSETSHTSVSNWAEDGENQISDMY